MSTEHEPLTGLPPVAAPSGKFIVQLFLVPLLIVTVAFGVLWSFQWLFGGNRTPEQFLRDLSSSNAEIRWRSASDLAQVLLKDQALASNPHFALDLGELLRQVLRDSEQKEPLEKALPGDRPFIQYLINCLGNFNIPTGAPMLNEIALAETRADAETVLIRRRDAVWALANLGKNLREFDRLPAETRDQILSGLEAETASLDARRAGWARSSLDYFRIRNSSNPSAMGVDVALAHCAQSPDPILRKFVALASRFWEGSPESNARIDETLLQLSYDDGHGGGDDSRIRGLEVRYHAVESLARRGSDQVKKRIGILGEMLDEERQEKNFSTKLPDGREVPDETAVVSTVTGALKSVAELHRRNPALDVSGLGPAIDNLMGNGNPYIRSEAEKTQATLHPR